MYPYGHVLETTDSIKNHIQFTINCEVGLFTNDLFTSFETKVFLVSGRSLD